MTANVFQPSSDVLDFATTVSRICRARPSGEQWTPEVPGDDRDAQVRTKLTDAGWFEVAAEPGGTAFLWEAAVVLGRELVSLDLVDGLLGHGVGLTSRISETVTLARYCDVGDTMWLMDGTGLALREVVASQPVNYIDSQAVGIVSTCETASDRLHPSAAEIDAWMTAMTGYIAGVAIAALELAGGYAQQRVAFGKPLAELDAVAKKLADCATAAEGLLLARRCVPDPYVLSQAGNTAFRILRSCHQIVGGIGFTLEYPLQRYSRRVEALRVWTPDIVAALAFHRETV